MQKRYLPKEYCSNEAFWERNWDSGWKEKYTSHPIVILRLVKYMMKYLEPNMKILEGGCGDCQYVRYFNNHGLRTIGVDFAHDTVTKINQVLPDLDVRTGNVRNLEFPDETFDAYYSGGVIEHFEDGITPQLSEANRVLKTGGYFFVTVPHVNIVRRCSGIFLRTRNKIDLDGRRTFLKEWIEEFVTEPPPAGFHFHEYVFSSKEMHSFLEANGFSILESTCFSNRYGLCDIELYRYLTGIGKKHRTIINKFFAIPSRYARLIEESDLGICQFVHSLIGPMIAHMKLYICKKKSVT